MSVVDSFFRCSKIATAARNFKKKYEDHFWELRISSQLEETYPNLLPKIGSKPVPRPVEQPPAQPLGHSPNNLSLSPNQPEEAQMEAVKAESSPLKEDDAEQRSMREEVTPEQEVMKKNQQTRCKNQQTRCKNPWRMKHNQSENSMTSESVLDRVRSLVNLFPFSSRRGRHGNRPPFGKCGKQLWHLTHMCRCQWLEISLWIRAGISICKGCSRACGQLPGWGWSSRIWVRNPQYQSSGTEPDSSWLLGSTQVIEVTHQMRPQVADGMDGGWKLVVKGPGKRSPIGTRRTCFEIRHLFWSVIPNSRLSKLQET